MVTPPPTGSNAGQNCWSPEELEVLRVGKWEKKTAKQIGQELKEKFGVDRNPNVISKRWAQMKKE